ncbi:MAG: hypothetical protein KDK36_16515, partial [Leptospiraceae bacterium]|nr:hypothetical protein [Leptospiraceae bacterium]
TPKKKLPKPSKQNLKNLEIMDHLSDLETLNLESPSNKIIQKYNYSPVKEFSREEERKVYNIKVSSDGKYAFVITAFKIFRISFETLREDKVLDHRRVVEGGFTGIDITSDGSKIIGGNSWETRAYLYGWNGRPLKKYYCKQKNSYVENISISPNDKYILLSCLQFGKTIKETYLYTIDGELVFRKKIPEIYSQFTPDGRHFISYEKDIVTYWTIGGKQIQSWKLGMDIVSMSYNEDKNLLLLGNSKEWFISKIEKDESKISKSVNIKVGFNFFPSESYSLDSEFKTFQKLIGDGNLILSGGKSGAYLWDTKGKELKFYPGHVRNVSAVALSPDENFMVTASPDKTIVWKRK